MAKFGFFHDAGKDESLVLALSVRARFASTSGNTTYFHLRTSALLMKAFEGKLCTSNIWHDLSSSLAADHAQPKVVPAVKLPLRSKGFTNRSLTSESRFLAPFPTSRLPALSISANLSLRSHTLHELATLSAADRPRQTTAVLLDGVRSGVSCCCHRPCRC